MKEIIRGTQEQIAAQVCAWLGRDTGAHNVRLLVGFFQVQRHIARRETLTYNGITIGLTPRRMFCSRNV